MKISEDNENSFLFESLKDGDLSGRYSVIGIKPDKILKIRKKVSKIYDGKNIIETVNKEPIKAIRYFVNNSLIKITEDIPSIASGIFGYIGYDFVANIEELPREKIDEFNIPDCILLRPSITEVFDKNLNEILICKAVWYDDNISADTAFNLAKSELSEIEDENVIREVTVAMNAVLEAENRLEIQMGRKPKHTKINNLTGIFTFSELNWITIHQSNFTRL